MVPYPFSLRQYRIDLVNIENENFLYRYPLSISFHFLLNFLCDKGKGDIDNNLGVVYQIIEAI